jgi:hypothetical protein
MNLVTDPDLSKRLDQERSHAIDARQKLERSIREAKDSWTPFLLAVAELSEVKEERGHTILGRAFQVGSTTYYERFEEVCATDAIGVFVEKAVISKRDESTHVDVSIMLARRGHFGFWRKETRVQGTFALYPPTKYREHPSYSAYDKAMVPDAGIFHEDELQQLYDAMIVETVELHQRKTHEITKKSAEVQLLNFGVAR